ncbi:hypothetical protein CU102_24825 [Phyllobacterium brassicacearum]|uniref:Uncharacterized protein n=1 Tax=Phyllobacterium brassicacearum TaxID=314235 RepID=A0A2P7B926_9HYPH|nr:hypothetical protein CU102_24825 [Phyllobacterium brassicacearum]TDQ09170.1 hypothetical protein DEV91_15611 [Phyllobacterium brassicacearum]
MAVPVETNGIELAIRGFKWNKPFNVHADFGVCSKLAPLDKRSLENGANFPPNPIGSWNSTITFQSMSG